MSAEDIVIQNQGVDSGYWGKPRALVIEQLEKLLDESRGDSDKWSRIALQLKTVRGQPRLSKLSIEERAYAILTEGRNDDNLVSLKGWKGILSHLPDPVKAFKSKQSVASIAYRGLDASFLIEDTAISPSPFALEFEFTLMFKSVSDARNPFFIGGFSLWWELRGVQVSEPVFFGREQMGEN